MSIQGYYRFYSFKEIAPRLLVQSLLDICRGSQFLLGFRGSGPCGDWQKVKNLEDDNDSVPLSGPFGPEEFIRHMTLDTCMTADLYEAKLSYAIHESAHSTISREIFGDASPPSGVWISIGWHDMFSFATCEDGEYFGRPYWSLSLEGYSTPNDCVEYPKRLFGTPVVMELERKLKLLDPELKRCYHYSV
ncbi:MAG: hypothetical protein H6815_02330 [Phycisphaeraceae bacterium]|nr:hypothetical protein [Phycisphaerales bacterium]MCB9859264.1 hypothetical protein [Phycisphaeraceae bacterium]